MLVTSILATVFALLQIAAVPVDPVRYVYGTGEPLLPGEVMDMFPLYQDANGRAMFGVRKDGPARVVAPAFRKPVISEPSPSQQSITYPAFQHQTTTLKPAVPARECKIVYGTMLPNNAEKVRAIAASLIKDFSSTLEYMAALTRELNKVEIPGEFSVSLGSSSASNDFVVLDVPLSSGIARIAIGLTVYN